MTKSPYRMSLLTSELLVIYSSLMASPAPPYCLHPNTCVECRLAHLVAVRQYEVFSSRMTAVFRQWIRTRVKIPPSLFSAINASLSANRAIVDAQSAVQYLMATDQLKMAAAKWQQQINQYNEYMSLSPYRPPIEVDKSRVAAAAA